MIANPAPHVIDESRAKSDALAFAGAVDAAPCPATGDGSSLAPAYAGSTAAIGA